MEAERTQADRQWRSVNIVGHRGTDGIDVTALLASRHVVGLPSTIRVVKSTNVAIAQPTCPALSSSALELAKALEPDIVIADATGEALPDRDFSSVLGYRAAVIFVIDSPSKALFALDAGAIDCIPLPVHIERVERALIRAITWVGANRTSRARSMDSDLAAEPTRWMRLVHNGGIAVSPIENAMYFKAERKVTRVVTETMDGYLRMGINAVASLLDQRQFWRIHRGTIVNLAQVDAFRVDELGRVTAHLRNRNEALQVSRIYERVLLRDGLT